MRECVLVVAMVAMVIEAQWVRGRREGRGGIKRFDRGAWPEQVGEIRVPLMSSLVL